MPRDRCRSHTRCTCPWGVSCAQSLYIKAPRNPRACAPKPVNIFFLSPALGAPRTGDDRGGPFFSYFSQLLRRPKPVHQRLNFFLTRRYEYSLRGGGGGLQNK